MACGLGRGEVEWGEAWRATYHAALGPAGRARRKVDGRRRVERRVREGSVAVGVVVGVIKERSQRGNAHHRDSCRGQRLRGGARSNDHGRLAGGVERLEDGRRSRVGRGQRADTQAGNVRCHDAEHQVHAVEANHDRDVRRQGRLAEHRRRPACRSAQAAVRDGRRRRGRAVKHRRAAVPVEGGKVGHGGDVSGKAAAGQPPVPQFKLVPRMRRRGERRLWALNFSNSAGCPRTVSRV